MIELVIFDIGGVILLGDYPSERFSKVFGVPIEEITLIIEEKIFTPECKDIATYPIWRKKLLEWNIQMNQKEFFDFWFAGYSLNKELLEKIRILKNKVKNIVVFSNAFKEGAKWRKRLLKPLNIFTKFYFSNEIGFSKSNLKSYEIILNDFSIKPGEVLYVDDSEKYIELTKGAGIQTIHYVDNKKFLKDLRSLGFKFL